MDTTELTEPTTNENKPKRKTPTQRQIEALTTLEDDALVARALDAMFALNRRAKKLRDNRTSYRHATFARMLQDEIDGIYALKDRFVAVMALAGRARVFVFEVKTQDGWHCDRCDRDFWSSDPECFGCGCDADPQIDVEDWYLVDCGSHHRFHQPAVPEAVAALATPMEAHDPTQPQREIPNVGLTIEAQKACVRMATERLRALTSGQAA